MWPVLVLSDSARRCDALAELLRGLDRRIEPTTAIELDTALAWSVRFEPVLAVVAPHGEPEDGISAVAALHQAIPATALLAEVPDANPVFGLQALAFGAADYIRSPAPRWEWENRCRLLLRSWRQRHALRTALARATRRGAHRRPMALEAPAELISILASADRLHDSVTGAHDRRTGHLAGMIAEAMGLPNEECRQIASGAALHDIGKLAIPDRVLRKVGVFNDDDREVMRSHPEIGFEILRWSRSPLVRAGAEIALTHHERFDGSGYPSGLRAEAIPVAGRITAAADVFDALAAGRPYRAPLSPDDAFRYLRSLEGSHFDPQCVAALWERRDEAAQAVGRA